MREWIRYNRRNPCPVCDSHKHNCSTNRTTGITHCRGRVDHPDYRFLGEDKHGFGMFKPEAEIEAWQAQQKQEWLQEKENRRIEREKQWQEQLKQQLSPKERDRAIRHILEQLLLSPEHKELLKSRGLTEYQISEAEYCSVRQWQKLREPADSRLPGVNRKGGLNNPYDGILIPVPDHNGYYVGLRLHDPHCKKTGNPKYTWLTSSGRGLHPVLPNGEYPIAVYYPAQIRHPNRVGLCEGLEWKPKLAAERLGYPVIGFAGTSFFTHSPETLQATLDKLGRAEAVLIPDAGGILNHHVLTPYDELLSLAASWDYNLSIAWWHQIEKSNGDIDEISDAIEIAYLSAEKFREMAREVRRDRNLLTDEEILAIKEAEEAGGEEISEQAWRCLKAEEFWEWLKAKAKHQFNGFDESLNQRRWEREVKKLERLRYRKDPLPTPNTVNGILPRIEFEEGDRARCVQALIALGWDEILDLSFTGTGKSHQLNQIVPAEGKAWYLHGDHRNPTVSPAEEKTDLPSRHNGLVLDNSRTTPSGEPYRRRWQWRPEKPEPDIAGNCFQADRFNQLSAKGYDVNSRTAAAANGAMDNIICAGCPQRGACAQFGYKAERKEALAAPANRAHVESLPSPGGGEEGWDYQADIAVWEEAGTQFQATETRTLTQRDVDRQWNWLEELAPDSYRRLSPIKHKLNGILSGKIKIPHFGATSLPDAKGEENLAEVLGIEPYPELENDLMILWQIIENQKQLTDGDFQDFHKNRVDRHQGLTEKERKRWGSAIALADRHLYGETVQANDEIASSLPTLGLYDLLGILFGKERGVARVSCGAITLTLPYGRHREIADEMGVNLYADATVSPDQLAARRGINREQLAVIAQKQPDLSNLTVQAIYMEGMRSRQYSDDCIRRQLALVDHLQEDHIQGESALIAWKDTDYLDIDGYWFNDSRSTNLLKGVPSLIALGTPYQNYGAVKDEYVAIFGTLDGFDDYYDSLRQAEIIQLLGRQRAHLYPDTDFTIYLIGSNLDLSFLEAMGINVEISHSLEWSSQAGQHSQYLKLSLLQMAIELGQQFRQMTQSAIATRLGVTQGYISRFFKQIGGKTNLLKILQPLYKQFIGTVINPRSFFHLKEIRSWLNFDSQDAQALGLTVVKDCLDRLEAFFASGKEASLIEQETELPLIFLAAIALGSDPPPPT